MVAFLNLTLEIDIETEYLHHLHQNADGQCGFHRGIVEARSNEAFGLFQSAHQIARHFACVETVICLAGHQYVTVRRDIQGDFGEPESPRLVLVHQGFESECQGLPDLQAARVMHGAEGGDGRLGVGGGASGPGERHEQRVSLADHDGLAGEAVRGGPIVLQSEKCEGALGGVRGAAFAWPNPRGVGVQYLLRRRRRGNHGALHRLSLSGTRLQLHAVAPQLGAVARPLRIGPGWARREVEFGYLGDGEILGATSYNLDMAVLADLDAESLKQNGARIVGPRREDNLLAFAQAARIEQFAQSAYGAIRLVAVDALAAQNRHQRIAAVHKDRRRTDIRLCIRHIRRCGHGRRLIFHLRGL